VSQRVSLVLTLALAALPATTAFGAAPATAPPKLAPVLEALSAACPPAPEEGDTTCAAKLDLTLPLAGEERKGFVVVRLERAEPDGGASRLWIQAFRLGTLVDWGADGFGSVPEKGVDLPPYHLTQWVGTDSGREEAPPPGEDHYLGPLAVGDGVATDAEVVLLRASRSDDREPATAIYAFLLRSMLAGLVAGRELQVLEPGKPYCWNEDGSPTSCEE
jgi:hypothetical protein